MTKSIYKWTIIAGLSLILMATMADLLKEAGYNEYLTKVEKIDVQQVSQINSSPIQNLQSGGLVSDLKITKSGEVIPYSDDWNYADVTKIVYVSDNLVTIADSELYNRLQIGDKIIVSQTTTKYFYVVNKANNQITLNAGSDYTFTSGVFTSFGFSKLSNPDGFPSLFNYASTLSADGAIIITDQGTFNGKFYIANGDKITLLMERSGIVFGGSGTAQHLFENLPIPSDAVVNYNATSFGLTATSTTGFVWDIIRAASPSVYEMAPAEYVGVGGGYLAGQITYRFQHD